MSTWALTRDFIALAGAAADAAVIRGLCDGHRALTTSSRSPTGRVNIFPLPVELSR